MTSVKKLERVSCARPGREAEVTSIEIGAALGAIGQKPSWPLGNYLRSTGLGTAPLKRASRFYVTTGSGLGPKEDVVALVAASIAEAASTSKPLRPVIGSGCATIIMCSVMPATDSRS